jgi:hypothetical protein
MDMNDDAQALVGESERWGGMESKKTTAKEQQTTQEDDGAREERGEE